MHLRRVRIRTLMIAVAVAALAFGMVLNLFSMRRWASVCRSRAVLHAKEEKRFRLHESVLKSSFERHESAIEDSPSSPRWIREDAIAYPHWDSAERIRQADRIEARLERDSKDYRYALASLARRAEYHAELKRKYEWCAGHPWIGLPEEPPLPFVPESAGQINIGYGFNRPLR